MKIYIAGKVSGLDRQSVLQKFEKASGEVGARTQVPGQLSCLYTPFLNLCPLLSRTYCVQLEYQVGVGGMGSLDPLFRVTNSSSQQTHTHTHTHTQDSKHWLSQQTG